VKTFRYVTLLFLLGLTMQFANAQSEFNVAIGFGAVQDSKAVGGIEGDPNSNNFFGPCTLGSTATCSTSKALSGFMLGFRGDLMLWKHLGFGADVSFQPGKQDYVVFPSSAIAAGGANLQSRTTFYDFDAVARPIQTKRAAIELLGGIGGANLRFYATGSTTDALLGTQSFSQYYGSSNHFQLHAGFGVNVFVTNNVFIRPQFDLHWVNNLNQFGSNAVTEESVWIGYRWGGQ
jgi:hypothetical protein